LKGLSVLGVLVEFVLSRNQIRTIGPKKVGLGIEAAWTSDGF
jgi:hypothetical protein